MGKLCPDEIQKRTLVVCVVFQSTIWNGTPLIGTYSTCEQDRVSARRC